MASPDANRALIHHFFEEIESENIDIIDEVFADDYTTDAGVARTEIRKMDREALKTAWQENFAAFPDLCLESQELLVDGDSVVSIQTWRGTHEGEYRVFTPSGNDVSFDLWTRFVVEDGEVIQLNVQRDNFGLFTQLGLELSIEGYRTLIETAPDPIIIADADTGRIIETNSAAESIVECPREEIIGNHQRDLHPPTRRYDDLMEELVAQARESPTSVRTCSNGDDIELARTDGSRVLVEISTQVVTLAERTTLVSIYRDISEQRRREQRMQVLNRILRHNLGNELNVISGRAEVLAANTEGEVTEQANQILETARTLATLGRKARTADRITAAETTQASQVSIRGVVDEVVADISDTYPECEIQTEHADPITVLTDRDAVEIALRETVENAVEHGASGDSRESDGISSREDPSSVRVRVAPAKEEEQVQIVVEDDGPGIPEHELAVLDEGHETALTHGSGIGIWLVHWATAAIRGDTSYETAGTGTTVTLSVPSLDSAS